MGKKKTKQKETQKQTLRKFVCCESHLTPATAQASTFRHPLSMVHKNKRRLIRVVERNWFVTKQVVSCAASKCNSARTAAVHTHTEDTVLAAHTTRARSKHVCLIHVYVSKMSVDSVCMTNVTITQGSPQILSRGLSLALSRVAESLKVMNSVIILNGELLFPTKHIHGHIKKKKRKDACLHI